MSYRHLTIIERKSLQILRESGWTLSECAKKLNVSTSTLCREENRNSVNGRYDADYAQLLYENRHKKCCRSRVLSDEGKMKYVREHFQEDWSPEEIVKTYDNVYGKHLCGIETIYREIKRGNLGGKQEIKLHLRHKGKKRHKKGGKDKRGQFPIDHKIEDRPKEVRNQERFGDWEGDSVIGQKGGVCLTTLIERKSNLIRIILQDKLDAKSFLNGVSTALKNENVLTLTLDRGKENALHRELSKKLGDTTIYFTNPHSPWEKPVIENGNGLIRQYIPKGTDISKLPICYIKFVEDKLNNRPRKKLGFKTPNEVYYENLHLK